MNSITIISIAVFIIAREISEQAKDSKLPKRWGRWWNTKTSWRNKHEWQPSWLFKDILVMATDAEHFFQWLSHIAIALAFIPFGWLTCLLVWLIMIGLSGLMNLILNRIR